MTTYTKITDYAAKDSFLTGNPSKVVRGTEIDAEFTSIASADADSVKVSGLGANVAAFLATPSSANLAAAITDETGSGANVFATSPTLVTPALGTPSSGTLTSCTGLPISTGISGLGTGIATALAVNVGTAGSPVVNGGALGTPSSGTVTNLTGTASININGTVGATTPAAGTFTTLTSTGNATLGDAEASDTHAIKGATTLLANSASAALTVTQTGSGNAFVVEDSASTDGTPFVIDNAGNIGLGRYTPTAKIQFANTLDLAWDGTSAYAPGTSGARTFKFSDNNWYFDNYTGDIVFRGAAYAELARIGSDGASKHTANSTSAALTVTQTGSGNAFVVEDSASTDGTPFVIDAAGNTIIGGTAVIAEQYSGTSRLTVVAENSDGYYTIAAANFTNDSNGPIQSFLKSRSTSVGHTIVQSGDTVAEFRLQGSDGTGYIQAANIKAQVDGTPGPNDMPGRLIFSTTADGASSPTERMRIDASGNVGIGSVPSAGQSFANNKDITGATFGIATISAGQVRSDVTSQARYFQSFANTQATTFTCGVVIHYLADQGVFGSGSTVTTQTGFYASSALVGATNNYGFYGGIAAGTNRYNFYAAGTAPNYFAGDTTVAGTLTANGQTVGYLNIPQNSQSAPYTLVLGDAGKHILHPSADTTARTITIPANSSVAFPIGTAVTFVNQASAGVMTIAITTDTMRLAGAGTTGSRTLAANGVATAIKLTSTEWIISGTNLT